MLYYAKNSCLRSLHNWWREKFEAMLNHEEKDLQRTRSAGTKKLKRSGFGTSNFGILCFEMTRICSWKWILKIAGMRVGHNCGLGMQGSEGRRGPQVQPHLNCLVVLSRAFVVILKTRIKSYTS